MIKIEKADTFFKRLRGLIGRNKLPQGCGLMIAPCNSIHMLFMKFDIDAIFIDKNFTIKKIAENVRTWTGIAICIEGKSWKWSNDCDLFFCVNCRGAFKFKNYRQTLRLAKCTVEFSGKNSRQPHFTKNISDVDFLCVKYNLRVNADNSNGVLADVNLFSCDDNRNRL